MPQGSPSTQLGCRHNTLFLHGELRCFDKREAGYCHVCFIVHFDHYGTENSSCIEVLRHNLNPIPIHGKPSFSFDQNMTKRHASTRDSPIRIQSERDVLHLPVRELLLERHPEALEAGARGVDVGYADRDVPETAPGVAVP